MITSHNIPVSVLTQGNSDTTEPSSLLLALLQELRSMLNTLVQKSKSSVIDLHSLPLQPDDLRQLKRILGEGEVVARLSVLGPSHIVETQVPGIWWITHLNPNDEVMSEFIEVTDLPEILKTPAQDLRSAVSVLESRFVDACKA
jgi:hydrogenase-1 operon protein HyaF